MFTLESKPGHQRIIIILVSFLFATVCAFAKYSGGSGDPNDPYQIASDTDLLNLASDVNDYNKCFIMTSDIDLSNYIFDDAVISHFDPNAYNPASRFPFTEIFNGSGHIIRNLTIDSNGNFIGLFGYIQGGEVNNLGLENIWINVRGNRRSCIGGLIGCNEEGIINNCYSNGSVAGDLNCYNVGGLIGLNENGTISNCYSQGIVSSEGGESIPPPYCSHNIGGLLGSGGYITKSYSTCDVLCKGFTYNVGGLVGNGGIISECFSTGDVNCLGQSIDVGGFIGVGSNINNCYSIGNVTVASDSNSIGGFIGHYNNYQSDYIVNCYSVGTVTGGIENGYIGGLVGYNHWLTDINSSYFLNTSGSDNNYGEPLTDSEMKHQSSFVGWDFVCETNDGNENIWWIIENVTYPKLAWYWYDPNDPNCGGSSSGGGGGDGGGGRVGVPVQILYPPYDPDCNIPIYWSSANGANYYELENSYNGGAYTNIYTGTATNKGDLGLAPGLYRYRVRTCDVHNVCSDWRTGSFDCNAVLSTCYRDGNTADPNWNSWISVGRPDCWCKASTSQEPNGSGYQCDGDADGLTSGSPFNYRIYNNDFTMVTGNWMKTAAALTSDPNVTLAGKLKIHSACADFDHKSSGTPFNYRVYNNDLSKVTTNWMKLNSSSVTATNRLPGDCPR
jgi:hypothetical protein